MVEEELFRKFSSILLSNQNEFGETFLVGGYVRDKLSGRPSKDFDFVLERNSIHAARSIADHFRGSFYVMDYERQIARALINPDGEGAVMVDCSLLAPEGIKTDLERRDFTINAIAVNIASPDNYVDPLNGVDDLTQKRLNLCSPRSFILDPVRSIRAVRFIRSLNLTFTNEINLRIKESLSEIDSVSSERIRDEVCKILSLRHPNESIRLMDEFGLLPRIFPELLVLKKIEPEKPHVHNAYDHTLRVCEMLDLLVHSSLDNDTYNLTPQISEAVQEFKPYGEDLRQYFVREITPGRNLLALSHFAALYHDSAKPLIAPIIENDKVSYPNHAEKGAEIASQRGKSLSLSMEELVFIQRLVRQHMAMDIKSADDNTQVDLWLYRLFKQAGFSAIACCFLHLADILATYEHNLGQERWQQALSSVNKILDGWFHRYDQVAEPLKIVSGDDIMRRFNLPQGPLIGEMLELVREQQAMGRVSNQMEALKVVEQKLAGISG